LRLTTRKKLYDLEKRPYNLDSLLPEPTNPSLLGDLKAKLEALSFPKNVNGFLQRFV
jgi:hypothetical protein